MSDTLSVISQTVPVIVVVGQRGSGKTSLVHTVGGSSRQYLCLEDPELCQLARKFPDIFLTRYRPPLSIDNVHLAPQLINLIFQRVNKLTACGSYWLITSHSDALQTFSVQTNLRQYIATLRVLGFSQAELSGRALSHMPFLPTRAWVEQARCHVGEASPFGIYAAVWSGALPKLISDEELSRETRYENYIDDFLIRDIRSRRVSDLSKFRQFIKCAARHTAKPVNYADMAKEVGVNVHTAKSWLQILQSLGWVYLLQPRADIPTKLKIKTPKLFFLDTGLCAYLVNAGTPDELERGALNASIAETFMMTEIIKSYWNRGLSPNFAFYSDRAQKKVDLIIPSDQTLHPVEFRKTMVPRLSLAKNFSALDALTIPLGVGAIITLQTTDSALSDGVRAIPLRYI